jgi:DNA-binding transcriptional MocR family regulator
VATLVDGLGAWAGGSGALYRQLARGLAGAIERGELGHGDRLPSERALAGAVAVSRGVAVAAYDELVAQGLVERVVGSGTFVAGGPAALPAGREGSGLVARLVEQGRSPSLIDLSISVLHGAPGLPPVSIRAADLPGTVADSPWGLDHLRAQLARHVTRIGLPTEPDQLVVTTGAQQGISVAAGCWVRPGDAVVVDDPTYPGAIAAFEAAGARLVTVPVDRHGLVVEALAEALAERPALAYVQSGPHSPTGAELPARRRQRIADLLVAARVPLVEDLALEGLRWTPGPRPPVPIAAHAPDHPIAVVGSLSKLFWAGLRVGFVRAPEPVARRLVRVKATHDLGSSVPGQALASALLDHRRRDRFLARRDAVLADRAALAVRLLHERLPSWHVPEPRGGLSLWVRLPEPVAQPFAALALRHGVGVATAEGLSATGGHRDRLRLTFAVPEPDLRTAIDRLAAAWAALPHPARRSATDPHPHLAPRPAPLADP